MTTMDDDRVAPRDAESEPRPKATYETPSVTRLGTIRDITQSQATPSVREAFGGSI